MKVKKSHRARFRVGDWVTFLFGVGKVVAQIIEDRGPPGTSGRHFYRIRLDLTWAEPDMFDLPEEDMEAVPRPDKAMIVKYLKEGGLVALLQANLIREGRPKGVAELHPNRRPHKHLVPAAGRPGGGEGSLLCTDRDQGVRRQGRASDRLSGEFRSDPARGGRGHRCGRDGAVTTTVFIGGTIVLSDRLLPGGAVEGRGPHQRRTGTAGV